MAGRVNLERRVADMMKLISPEAENPGKHFKAANELIVDMADMGMETMELMERLYFITEGYKEKDTRPAGERFRSILKLHE
jgi:hypothetical protein